ncbi:AraC family transcriptional regulator [Tateyamaria sp. ANG-S1]|uniref:helix-turn-helix transcriptional regulator n=1 Tax=Tateyamaria sp. ANG-S1 TaxID=1577905 RepID=UPI00068F5D9C|nr:AraC family transcriptional regulator [Tateyamaria sp. ANG-S1]
MPHFAAVSNDMPNFPVISPIASSVSAAGDRQAQDRTTHHLTTKSYHRIIARMRARIDERITEESLCALSSLNKEAFRRAFKARAGMGPMRYLTWLRVDMAVRLLIDTRFDLKEIAFVTGFKSEQGLIAAFVSTLGVRPHALRASPI